MNNPPPAADGGTLEELGASPPPHMVVEGAGGESADTGEPNELALGAQQQMVVSCKPSGPSSEAIKEAI